MVENPQLEGAVLELTDISHNIFTALGHLCGSGGYFLSDQSIINVPNKDLWDGVKVSVKTRTPIRDDLELGATANGILYEVTLRDPRSRRSPIRCDFFQSKYGGICCVYRQCDTFNLSHPYVIQYSEPSITIQDCGGGYGAKITRHRLAEEGFTSSQVAGVTQEVTLDLRSLEATFVAELKKRHTQLDEPSKGPGGPDAYEAGFIRPVIGQIERSVKDRATLLLNRNRNNLPTGETGVIF